MNRADDLWPVLWPTVPERPVDALATCSRHFSAWPWNIINPLTIVMLSAAKIVGWGPMQTWPSLLAESGPFSSPARPVWPASVGFSISLSLQFLFLWHKKKRRKKSCTDLCVCATRRSIHFPTDAIFLHSIFWGQFNQNKWKFHYILVQVWGSDLEK